MIVWGPKVNDLAHILRSVSREHFEGNLDFRRLHDEGLGVRFTLRVFSSQKPGHGIGFSGRRTISACWHAHRDFMAELFKQFPEARLKSALADYRGADEFASLFETTGSRNAGSRMEPRMYRDMCECGR